MANVQFINVVYNNYEQVLSINESNDISVSTLYN